MPQFVIINVGKEMDAEGNHGCVGPFKSQTAAIDAVKEWVGVHESDIDETQSEDFLDDATPFYRVTDNYGNQFELHVVQMETTLEEQLSYGE